MDNQEAIELLSKVADYLKNFTVQSREQDIAIQKIEEAVFWLTYNLED